jgi:hypothetical protein
MELTITVRKTGGIWHGTINGYLDVDERGLTPEIAERKAREVAERTHGDAGTITFKVRRVAPGD